MALPKIKKEDYMHDPEYGWELSQDTYCYKMYKKLTDEQREKIEDLKNHIGKKVLFKRYWGFRKEQLTKEMELKAVILKKGEIIDGVYRFYPYFFRLDFINCGNFYRGFWSMDIDSLEILEDENANIA